MQIIIKKKLKIEYKNRGNLHESTVLTFRVIRNVFRFSLSDEITF